MPKSLWGEAIHFIVWVKNRVTTWVLGNVTPYKQLNGSKPDLSRVPEWGQKVWVHQGSGSKLDGCATEAQWVGFDADSTHAHRIYWPDKNHVSVKCNIKFVSGTVSIPIPPLLIPNSTPTMSTLLPTQPTITQIPTQLLTPPVSKIITSTSKEKQCTLPLPPPATKSREEEMPDEEEENTAPIQQTITQQLPAPAIQRSSHIAQQTQSISTPKKKNKNKTKSFNKDSPKFINDRVFRGYHPDYRGNPSAALLADDEQALIFHVALDTLIASAMQEICSNPKTLKEVQSCLDWPLWKEAMDKEMDTLQQASTWSTIDHLPGKNIVGSKWVFCIKCKANSTIEKYKAQLVVCGFTQVYGVDYLETFLPVTKLASFRTILAIATHHDWDIESFDFNGTYLNGTLGDGEEIYMQEPPGYETQGEIFIKQLHKALYGLKQARRKWYEALSSALIDLGFCICKADPGVFIAQPQHHILIIAIHIDDCAFTASFPSLIDKYRGKLNAHYSLTDLGPIHWLLGIKITHNHPVHIISLSQTSYIDSIIMHFNLNDAKSYGTPMVPGAIYLK